jgi:hypothetical protein
VALTVSATSTDDVYTTTAYVKALMGTTSTANDATLSAMIRAASRWADNYLGYPLALASYEETVAGYDRRRLMLQRTPLRSVDGFYYGTDSGTNTQLLTSEFRVDSREGGFLSRDEGFEWTVPTESELTMRPRVGQEFKPWLIQYAAGWTYGGLTTDSPHWSTEAGSTSTGRTLPEDIEHAVALRARELYEGNEDVTMEMLGDLQVHYRSAARDPEVAKQTAYEAILDPYRRIV